MPNVIQTWGGIAAPIAMVPQLVTVDAPNVAPTPVSDLTVLDITGTTATLQWGLSTDSDGTVVGYRVYEVVGGVDTLRYSPTTSPQAITGLTAGTPYTWRVTAIDEDGAQSPTSTVGFTTVSTDTTAPSVPGSLASSGITSTGFTLTWVASTDAESGMSHYEVFDTDGNIIRSVQHPTVTTAFTGLVQGTTYHMRVKAVDNAGNKQQTAATLDVQTMAVGDPAPPPPTGFAVDDQTTTTANLSWTAPSVTTDVAGYNLYFWNGSTETPTTPGATTATNITLTGLTQNTPYTVRLKSRDASLQFSTFVQTTFTTSAVAVTVQPPTGLAVDSKTDTTATLSWTASTTAGVTGYNLYRLAGGVETATTPAATPSSPITITGLTASTPYTIRVKARDASFNFSAPAVVSFTTNATPDTIAPAAPTNITFPTVTTNSVTVQWVPSTAGDLAGHQVYRLIDTVWTALGNPKPAGTNTHDTLNLDPATDYQFRVRALDTSGNLSTPANACQGLVTTASTTQGGSNPLAGQFGLVTANVGTLEQLTEVNALVNKVNGNPKADPKMTIYRKAVEWHQIHTPPDTWTTGNAIQFANEVATTGGKLLFCCDYTHIDYVRTINLGMATAVAGNHYITLDNVTGFGNTAATGQAPTSTSRGQGKWGAIAVGLRDPGTGQWMTNIIPMTGNNVCISQDQSDGGPGNWNDPGTKKQINLTRGYTQGGPQGRIDIPFNLPAGGRGELIVGVRRSQESDKMTPRCSASNDNATTVDELEGYGRFCYNTCSRVGGNRIWAVEMSNEVNHFCGVLPYADPALWYRNMCHGYCGIKKAAPNAYVVAPGAGNNNGTFQHMPEPVRWYTLLKAERTTNQPNYFSNLKASMGVTSPGPDPWDWLACHTYCQNPGAVSTSSENAMNRMAAIYNLFNGTYPIMPTEQGPSWNAVGAGGSDLGAGDPLNAAGAANWWKALTDYCHGNRRWNHNVQLTGTDGLTLGKVIGSGPGEATLAQHQAAAARIFRPPMHFAMATPSGGELGNSKGMYSGQALSTRKFTIAPGNGDIIDLMALYT
jgi:hypothetical protein